MISIIASFILNSFSPARSKVYRISTFREIVETLVNIGGTFVILLLARSRYGYQVARKKLEETKKELMKENERCQQRSHELEEALNEKQILLREINHRVKNNLLMVKNMLDMEARRSDGDSDVLVDLASRVKSMAILHEQLQQPDDLNDISPGNYFQKIVLEIVNTLATDPDKVEVDLSVDVETLDIDKAVPCGLIANELISNALQHGLENQSGKIEVKLDYEGDSVLLSVADSGGNGPEDLGSLEEPNSLGLKLVRILVEDELNGTLSYETDTDWTRFQAEFPASQ